MGIWKHLVKIKVVQTCVHFTHTLTDTYTQKHFTDLEQMGCSYSRMVLRGLLNGIENNVLVLFLIIID